MTKSKFFTEIAILRGLSILAVFFYHVNPYFVKSGYLGVDVFFVISGFLMAALYSDILDVKGRTGQFYKKRANRIFPAYFVILFGGIAISAYLTLPHELNDILARQRWSLFFMPNIGFWSESSYFESAQFKPLLNFWSLGVEIQFYILFPLLIWFFKWSKWWLVFAGVVSFVLCFYLAGLSPKTAFFLTPCRVWQFLLGFFAAQLVGRKKFAKPVLPVLGSLALLALIGVMFWSFNQRTHLQYGSLVISLLAVSVIVLGLPKKFMTGLGGKVLQVLGTYSYSIYLVHFPIIAFFLYEPFGGLDLQPLGLKNLLAVLFLTTVFSTILYHLAETPFRRGLLGRYYKPVYASAGCVLLLFGALLPTVQAANFSKQSMLTFNAWQDRAVYRCGKLKRLTQPVGASCLLTKDYGPAASSYLLVGDSHADAIKETLRSLAADKRINLRMMKDNCNLGERACAPDQLIKEINRYGLDGIIVHSLQENTRASTLKSLLDVAPASFRLVYVAPVPVWPFHVPRAFYEAQIKEKNLWEINPSQTKEDYERSVAQLLTDIRSLNDPRLSVVEVSDALCSPECQVNDENGRLLYFDSHHLTLTGAEYIRNRLEYVYDISW